MDTDLLAGSFHLAWPQADRHLAACARCRDALAALGVIVWSTEGGYLYASGMTFPQYLANWKTCESLGYVKGELACSAACRAKSPRCSSGARA